VERQVVLVRKRKNDRGAHIRAGGRTPISKVNQTASKGRKEKKKWVYEEKKKMAERQQQQKRRKQKQRSVDDSRRPTPKLLISGRSLLEGKRR